MMDHTPYKRRKQHEEQRRSLSPTNDDVLTSAPVMTGLLSDSRRQIYPPEPTKIGVPYRTRRRRHYNKSGEDSDVSVISFNSGTTFGRFSQYLQQSPDRLNSTQRSDIQQSTEQFSQPATPLDLASYTPSNRPYSPIQSSSRLYGWKTSDDFGGANRLAASPLRTDHTPLDIEEIDDDMKNWTAVNNMKSFGKARQLSPSPTKHTDTAAKQQQRPAPGDNDRSMNNRNNDKYLDGDDDDNQLGLQLQPQPSTKIIEMVTDSEDEDDQHLASLKQTYRQLPRLRDDQILQTLSWTIPKDTDDRMSIPSQDKHHLSTAAITKQIRTTTKMGLYMKKQQKPTSMTTDEDEQRNKAEAAPLPSQKTLGKRPAYEVDAGHAMEQHKTPSPTSGMNKRSPSVLSIDYAYDEDNYENRTPPIALTRPATTNELGKKPSQVFPSIDDDADDLNLYDISDEEMMEGEPREQSIPDIPRINTHVNLARKLMKGSGTLDTPTQKHNYIPLAVTKSLFESALPRGTTLKYGCTKALTEATNLYFKQLLDDLEAYGEHSGESVIDEKDMELLMTRQRLVTETTSLEALAHEHLPRDLWDELCVSALAHNYLYPKRR